MDPTQKTFSANGGGLALNKVSVRVTKRGGAGVLGQACVFDFTNTDAAVNNNIAGKADSGTSNVRVPVTADKNNGVPAVLLAACADDALVEVATEGPVTALVIKASGNIAAGDPLYHDNAAVGLTADSPGVGAKIVAMSAGAVTGPSTATLAPVILGHFGAAVS